MHPDHTYLSRAPSNIFDERMREKVVKYINELAEDFGLLVQTGGLACNYFDRYMATLHEGGLESKRLIQLIASTCLLIAAKFFDRKLPPLSQLAVVHNGAAAPAQFATLEAKILEALRWQLHVPMPHAFIDPLRQCMPNAPFDASTDSRVRFFIDLSVYSYELLAYNPAEVAAGSLLAAWSFSGQQSDVRLHLASLAHASATTEQRLLECAQSLVRYYHVCFPEAANVSEPSSETVFTPIQADACDDASQAKSRPGASSPDSVMAMQ